MWKWHSFGLRLIPKIFKAVADTLRFIFQENGVYHNMHYLEHQTHNKALQLAMEWCNRLGMPIAESNIEGPVECIVRLR